MSALPGPYDQIFACMESCYDSCGALPDQSMNIYVSVGMCTCLQCLQLCAASNVYRASVSFSLVQQIMPDLSFCFNGGLVT
jgi:hypothetical protein